MELLTIKSDEQYLRFTAQGYELTNMSKASVYPLSQENKVVEFYNKYLSELNNLQVKKLIIIEEDYNI